MTEMEMGSLHQQKTASREVKDNRVTSVCSCSACLGPSRAKQDEDGGRCV